MRIDDKPEVNHVPVQSSETSTSSVDIKDVLADVGKVLKAMQATTIKSLKVNNMYHNDKQKIVKEIQAEMPVKSGGFVRTMDYPNDKQNIVEEIQSEMP